MKVVLKSRADGAGVAIFALGGIVAGPKKLGTFGASYLYPIFVRLGVIRENAA